MGKPRPTKKLKAWMVVSRLGHPVQENHPWGFNYIIAQLKGAASIWRDGERVVKVEIRVLDPE